MEGGGRREEGGGRREEGGGWRVEGGGREMSDSQQTHRLDRRDLRTKPSAPISSFATC